ncbi:hypothetical protein Acr_15g0006820 [Actinidia rufa]|uniref:Retrotransposon gag domain-containing protein n=1 Tax=Actinidia rufa TaxID=165716 RepID=A0A7J0FTQ9_9ERIC|nr:hypothetical protein Acr_15g0006820 [Actinidia rufa]
MATTSDVTEHGGVQERDTLPPIGKGKRSKSADIMASLEARLQRVEFAMADNRDKVEDIDQRIDGLEGGHEEFHREMQGILNSLAESWKVQMDALKDSLQAEIAAMKEKIKEVKGDWFLCKMAVTQGTIYSSHSPKVDIPRPKSYNGSRNERELDNFLWDLDQYFEATATWEDFKREIKRQFYPINSEHEARARLRRLSHKSTIRDYVKEFSKLMLEIPDMIEKESLFTFIDRLQSWAKLEVQRQGPQDLATVISIVESLGLPTKSKASSPHPGSLRLLNAIKTKVGKTKVPKKGRMYVEAKAVNTEARPIYGVARDVRLYIGDWCGQVDFTVVPVDDYPIVLGMEFLDGMRAFPIPFTETMCIMGERSAYMVPLAREASLKSKALSAMQLTKEEKWANKNRWSNHMRVKLLNSKPNDSKESPWWRDKSCRGSSRRAISTPRESPYGHSWTRSPNFERQRRRHRQIGWGKILQAQQNPPKWPNHLAHEEGQVACKA